MQFSFSLWMRDYKISCGLFPLVRASAITCHSIRCEMKQLAFHFFHSQTLWAVRHCQGFSRLVILTGGGNRASCLRIAELCCNTTSHCCSLHFHCFPLVGGDMLHATLISGFQCLYACNGASPLYCTFQFQLLLLDAFWGCACVEMDVYRGREKHSAEGILYN